MGVTWLFLAIQLWQHYGQQQKQQEHTEEEVSNRVHDRNVSDKVSDRNYNHDYTTSRVGFNQSAMCMRRRLVHGCRKRRRLLYS